MADVVNQLKRKEMMAGIRNKNTRPEMLIRKALFARGYRYRLHHKSLPGKPDIVLSRYKATIFINGCFWHCHDCHLFKWPQSRTAFWKTKIDANKARDAKTKTALLAAGWRILVVWECALKGKTRQQPQDVFDQIEAWISSSTPYQVICGHSSP